MEKFRIRPAKPEDLKQIGKVYVHARRFMAENGNPTQWKCEHPHHELLEEDIRQGRLYVAERAEEIRGVFAFVIGEDPTYGYIEQGAWLSDSVYGTIHRIASLGGGVFPAALAFCREKCAHIRIDTHADNKPMQHLVHKYGFVKCGIIYVEDGTPRIAYELI